MAKSQLFAAAAVRVHPRRGVSRAARHRDDEAFKTAHAILERGDIVVMYAEAGRSRTGELGKPRHGLGRLALETGVPVVHRAIAGTVAQLEAPAVPQVRRSSRRRCGSRPWSTPRASRPRPLRRSCSSGCGRCTAGSRARATAAQRARPFGPPPGRRLSLGRAAVPAARGAGSCRWATRGSRPPAPRAGCACAAPRGRPPRPSGRRRPPPRVTMKAVGISPASSSGAPTTAAAPTAGCVHRSASSSAGATWKALNLISS